MIESQVLNVNNAEFLPKVLSIVATGKHVTIPLKGFSMNPWLVGGRDTGVLQSVVDPLKTDDIVLAELTPGHYVLHRIWQIDGDNITLLGDGNLQADPVISRSQVRAIAKEFYRNGRKQSVDERSVRLYAWMWRRLRPVRRIILGIYRRTLLKLASSRGQTL